MVATYQDGATVAELAVSFGCGKSRMCTALKDAGVTFDPGARIAKKMTGRPGVRAGAKHTEESKRKMSETRMGRPGTRFGPHSAETLSKISAGTKGKNMRYSPEQRKELEQMRARAKRFVRRTLAATGRRKEIPSEQYLGYSRHELLTWLGQKPFADAEVDHYVPVVEFFRRGITDPAVVNALVNLRWLSSAQNKLKSDTLPADTEQVITACLAAAGKGLPA